MRGLITYSTSRHHWPQLATSQFSSTLLLALCLEFLLFRLGKVTRRGRSPLCGRMPPQILVFSQVLHIGLQSFLLVFPFIVTNYYKQKHMDSSFWWSWLGSYVTLIKLLNLHLHDLIFKMPIKIVLMHGLARIKGENRLNTLPSPDTLALVPVFPSSFTLFLSSYTIFLKVESPLDAFASIFLLLISQLCCTHFCSHLSTFSTTQRLFQQSPPAAVAKALCPLQSLFP